MVKLNLKLMTLVIGAAALFGGTATAADYSTVNGAMCVPQTPVTGNAYSRGADGITAGTDAGMFLYVSCPIIRDQVPGNLVDLDVRYYATSSYDGCSVEGVSHYGSVLSMQGMMAAGTGDKNIDFNELDVGGSYYATYSMSCWISPGSKLYGYRIYED